MRIFRAYKCEGHKAFKCASLTLALFLSTAPAQTIEYNEKLPAIAPPSASFTGGPDVSAPTSVSPKNLDNPAEITIKPIAPPEPAPALSPTGIYNKGALAYQRQDFESALKYWIKASEMGVLGATWRVARMYRSGIGTAVDHAKAYTYLQRVAEKHSFDSQRNHLSHITLDALVYLGIYYRYGLPVKKIKPAPEKALKIFRYAASHGQHPVAQYHLGDMYVSGNGVKANGARGMRWMNLAAKKNHAPSLAALGELYWQGKSVDLDKSRAMMFFALAVQTSRGPGKDKFRERLTMLRATATEQEIEQAQNLMIKWVERNQGKRRN